MVSILPSARTGMDVLGEHLGRGMTNAMPQMYENQRRQMGMKAFENAEAEIAKAGNDPYKIALALAKAGTQAPGMERALGPLIQTAMQNAVTKNAFPNAPGMTPQGAPAAMPGMPPQTQQAPSQAMPQQEGAAPTPQQQEVATPSPFNVMTGPEIDAASQAYAIAKRDPGAYAERQGQLNNLNTIATNQRKAFEEMALGAGVKPEDLPRFLQTGAKFDITNPSEWFQKTNRAFGKVKSNDEKLQNAFIPGIGQGILGYDREKELDRITPIVQDQVKRGLETETRNFLADNYLTPAEIELRIHPMTNKQKAAIEKVPRGFFPPETNLGKRIFASPENPFISYEEAQVKAPRELQQMQDGLADFFLKNVDKDTSLLGLREKLWKDRDYDWRQIGPAIRQSMQMGLKLTPEQETEMSSVEGQAPAQSLPDLFKDWSRIPAYLRGAK